MPELLPRWRLFAREIECDLSIYHRLDIGEWHEGRVSSRKVITLLDGLTNDCWYKLSLQRYIAEYKDEQEHKYSSDVGGLIFAQLTGQVVEISE